MGRTVIERFPVGGGPAVLPPEFSGTGSVVRAQGIQAHLLVVAQEHRHVRRIHDFPQNIDAQCAAVYRVPEDIHLVGIGKTNQLQHPFQFVRLAVDIRYAVNHAHTLFS